MTESAPQTQGDLEAQPLLPVRRLNNFVFCPRLFFFQWANFGDGLPEAVHARSAALDVALERTFGIQTVTRARFLASLRASL